MEAAFKPGGGTRPGDPRAVAALGALAFGVLKASGIWRGILISQKIDPYGRDDRDSRHFEVAAIALCARPRLPRGNSPRELRSRGRQARRGRSGCSRRCVLLAARLRGRARLQCAFRRGPPGVAVLAPLVEASGVGGGGRNCATPRCLGRLQLGQGRPAPLSVRYERAGQAKRRSPVRRRRRALRRAGAGHLSVAALPCHRRSQPAPVILIQMCLAALLPPPPQRLGRLTVTVLERRAPDLQHVLVEKPMGEMAALAGSSWPAPVS